MSDDGGGCCKGILALLSGIFVAVGFTSVGIGVWFMQATLIVIAQGTLLVIVGAGGLCCVCKRSRSGLKGFSIFLAVLALADVIYGMVVLFMCEQGCLIVPQAIEQHKPLVAMVFFGTAVLLIVALVCCTCLLKQSRRINVEMSARFSAKL